MANVAKNARNVRCQAISLIVIIAGIYFVLFAFILPARYFYHSDPGMKFIQIQNLARVPPSVALKDPATDWTTNPRYSALREFSVWLNGSHFSVFSIFYAVLNVIPFKVFGAAGVYLVSALSALAAIWLTYQLSQSISGRGGQWDVILALGIGSPLFFYAVELYEHAAGALFAVASVFCLWKAIRRENGQRLWAAGLLAGVGVWFRTELYMLIIAEGLALILLIPRAYRLRNLLCFIGSAVLGLIPLWVVNSIIYDNPVGAHLIVNWGLRDYPLTMRELLSYFLQSRRLVLRMLFPIHWARWVMVYLVALAGIVLHYLSPKLTKSFIFWASFVVTIGAGLFFTAVYLSGPWGLESLFEALPIALLLPWLALSQHTRDSASPAKPDAILGTKLLAIVGLGYLVLVVLTSPVPGGVQWGGRLFLPAVPLLVVLAKISYERLVSRWGPSGQGWGKKLLAGTWYALVAVSIAVQCVGISQLYSIKRSYERLGETLLEMPNQPIVTNLWWFPLAMSSIFYDRPFLRADTCADLGELAGAIASRGTSAFTYVSAPAVVSDLSQASCPGLAGWRAGSMIKIPLWTPVHIVSYYRVE